MQKTVGEAEARVFAATAAEDGMPDGIPSPRQQRLSAAVQEAARTVAGLTSNPLARSVIPAVRTARREALSALQARVKAQALELREAIARRAALEAKIAALQGVGSGGQQAPRHRASVKAMRV